MELFGELCIRLRTGRSKSVRGLRTYALDSVGGPASLKPSIHWLIFMFDVSQPKEAPSDRQLQELGARR